MKVLKWFSLFFMSMGITLLIGIVIGFRLEEYFYPQEELTKYVEESLEQQKTKNIVQNRENDNALQMVAVSGKEEKLNANTEYICIEYDILTGEEVPIHTKLPHKYMGLNREQLVEALKEYEQNPPLEERERGLVGVELRRFSTEEVEVLMNYQYVQPSESFYIVVYNGKIRVLLDDGETVYMETGIYVPDLPVDLQQKIVQGMYVPSEEELYDFLENYTS